MGMVHGPNIVTDGLIMMLDAGNTKSYSGSGSTWYDLVGSDDTTLYNSPTHSTDGGGCFDFNGTNQYALTNTDLRAIGNIITFSIWYRVESTAVKNVMNMAIWRSNANFFEWGIRDPYSSTPISIENWAYSDLNYVRNDWDWGTNPESTVNEWKNVTTTLNAGTGYGYLNGTQITAAGGDTYSWTPWSTALYQAGFYLATGAFYHHNSAALSSYCDCQIAMAHLWNRALTAAEVLQNYNAHKSRFGL